jgi:hypothetical protein
MYAEPAAFSIVPILRKMGLSPFFSLRPSDFSTSFFVRIIGISVPCLSLRLEETKFPEWFKSDLEKPDIYFFKNKNHGMIWLSVIYRQHGPEAVTQIGNVQSGPYFVVAQLPFLLKLADRKFAGNSSCIRIRWQDESVQHQCLH